MLIFSLPYSFFQKFHQTVNACLPSSSRLSQWTTMTVSFSARLYIIMKHEENSTNCVVQYLHIEQFWAFYSPEDPINLNSGHKSNCLFQQTSEGLQTDLCCLITVSLLNHNLLFLFKFRNDKPVVSLMEKNVSSCRGKWFEHCNAINIR